MITSPIYVRELPGHHRLEGGQCSNCGLRFFPQRMVCPGCRSREIQSIKLADTGKVSTFTIIRVAPEQFADQAPYAVGIVELDDGVRLMCQIADCDFEKIHTGMPVRMEFRKISEDGPKGIIAYGHKAVPR